MSYKDWDWVMGVNLDGVINGVQTFVDRIKSHGEGGHIVNTASMAGQIAIPGLGVYNTTKYAVVGMSETMRADLAPHNIGVSVLCPGVVTTNIFNSGRNRPDGSAGRNRQPRRWCSRPTSPTRNRPRACSRSWRARSIRPWSATWCSRRFRRTMPTSSRTRSLKPMVDARSAAINESFARWTQYRKDHGV